MITATTAIAALLAYVVGTKDQAICVKSAILVAVMGIVIHVLAGALVGIQ